MTNTCVVLVNDKAPNLEILVEFFEGEEAFSMQAGADCYVTQPCRRDANWTSIRISGQGAGNIAIASNDLGSRENRH